MDYALTDEQQATQEAIRRFVQAEYPYAQRGDAVDAATAEQRWTALAQMGLLGMAIDSRWGGSQQGPVELALLARELGRGHAGEGCLPNMVLAGSLLQWLGTEAQCEQWLAPMVAGQRKLALAYSEATSRYALAHVQTRAQPTPDGYRLNGQKSLVLGGAQADALLVLARTDGKPQEVQGLSLFVVPARTAGLRIQPFQTLDGRQAAHLVLEDVQVDESARLGALGQAYEALHKAVDLGLLWTCAEALGAMETLVQATTEHVKTRRQFGAPLARFQALQHRLADVMIGLEQTEAMVFAAAMMMQEAPADLLRRVLATTKVLTGRAAQAASETAIQLHGAMGMTAECRVGHFAKLLTTLTLLFGDPHHHTRWYADHALPGNGSDDVQNKVTHAKELA